MIRETEFAPDSRNWKFESISLQRRVCEISVPERDYRFGRGGLFADQYVVGSRSGADADAEQGVD
jgi:hypothetical protein